MVGSRIKKYLEEKGISQTFLAEKSTVPISALNPILNEKRKVTAEEYFLICEALNVSTEKFKNGSEIEEAS